MKNYFFYGWLYPLLIWYISKFYRRSGYPLKLFILIINFIRPSKFIFSPVCHFKPAKTSKKDPQSRTTLHVLVVTIKNIKIKFLHYTNKTFHYHDSCTLLSSWSGGRSESAEPRRTLWYSPSGLDSFRTLNNNGLLLRCWSSGFSTFSAFYRRSEHLFKTDVCLGQYFKDLNCAIAHLKYNVL